MKKVLYGLLIVLIMVIVSGCGKEDRMVGKYYLIEIKSGGETYSKSLIETLGLDFTLEIKKDNKATLLMGNEILDLKYDNQKFISVSDEEDIFTYTINGNVITLNYNKENMTFEKRNK